MVQNPQRLDAVESSNTTRISNRRSDFFILFNSNNLVFDWFGPQDALPGGMFAAKGNSKIYHLAEGRGKKTVCGLKVLKLSGPLTKYSNVQFTNKPPRGRKLCEHCKRIWREASVHGPTRSNTDIEEETPGFN